MNNTSSPEHVQSAAFGALKDASPLMPPPELLRGHAGAFAELLGEGALIAKGVVEGDLDDGLWRGSRNNRDGWNPSMKDQKEMAWTQPMGWR